MRNDIYFVELNLEDSKNGLISENFYWLAENDDFTFFSEFPDVMLNVEIEKVKMDTQILYWIRLENPSGYLAFFIHPSIRKGKEGGEVLPSFWSDNYFSLLPGKSRQITVEIQKSGLDGQQAYLKLDGWNILPRLVKIE